ncbi:MAG: GNAT family N-acetyltransferase, partial [Actinobacteria bacterium]|nr:GNAT family N-acetyltransferase [Actinomycetota bacterium]
MEVRACDADDLTRLRQDWPAAAGVAESHYAEQQAGHASFLVAWRDGVPLGWGMVRWSGCLGVNARAAFPATPEIVHLQVRPEHRNAGVGTALLGAAEHAVAGRSLDSTALSVSLANPDAARLYERRGYRRTGI